MSPVSPALAGRFFTTEPPGKPQWGLKPLFSWWMVMGVFRIQTAANAVDKGRYENPRSSFVKMSRQQKIDNYIERIRKQEDRADKTDYITSRERVNTEYIIRHFRIPISVPVKF